MTTAVAARPRQRCARRRLSWRHGDLRSI